ncbi:UbiA prenyltransferase family-domain-containing protein [Rostrohypoxylon terebratum]|nr:UbiA prenyltransferase family-domain-containing protein [Rostrohypoxylon terebratum]
MRDSTQSRSQSPSVEEEHSSLLSTSGSKLESHGKLLSHLKQSFSSLKRFLRISWLLTASDVLTFIGPNTTFGLCGALSAPWMMASGSGNDGEEVSVLRVLSRLGLVILFSWSNLVIFDLSNQRLPESAAEDALNKPSRPVPSGLVTCDQIRRAMLYLIPMVVALNHFVLGVGVESLALVVLTWLYNDLHGGDESYITRNAMLAAAFGAYNTGSVKVAVGTDAMRNTWLLAGFSHRGVMWAAMVSAVIFTTMQIQDFKDIEGDRARGRRTAPIVMGDRPARWSFAIPVLVWSVAGAWIWDASLVLATPEVALGTFIAFRCLQYSGLQADMLTWKLWCLWTAMLYMLPPLSYHLSAHVKA